MYGVEGRTLKARKALAVINDYLARLGWRPEDLALLDISCSTGYLGTEAGGFAKARGKDLRQPLVDLEVEDVLDFEAPSHFDGTVSAARR